MNQTREEKRNRLFRDGMTDVPRREKRNRQQRVENVNMVPIPLGMSSCHEGRRTINEQITALRKNLFRIGKRLDKAIKNGDIERIAKLELLRDNTIIQLKAIS